MGPCLARGRTTVLAMGQQGTRLGSSVALAVALGQEREWAGPVLELYNPPLLQIGVDISGKNGLGKLFNHLYG